MRSSSASTQLAARTIALHGGELGATGRNYVRANGTIDPLDSAAAVEMEPGDTIVIETPGGGGYGSLKII